MVGPEDIAISLGRPTPASDSPESRQWTRWIEFAEMVLRAGLTERGVDPATVDQHLFDHVLTEVVAARAERPGAATQVDVAVDDARFSRRYGPTEDGFVVSDKLWALLVPAAVVDPGAWSFAPSEA